MDIVSDFIVRLKNGYCSRRSSILVINTKQIVILLGLLMKLGYIVSFKQVSYKYIEVFLSYYQNVPAIRFVRRVSKPSHRIYLKLSDIVDRHSGNTSSSFNGFFVLSTPKGIVTDVEAEFLGVGGEVLFQIA